ncbi:MAG TPA: hypothetical protein VI322_02730 [Candidatus Saccharimonadia bacterium]
MSARTVAIRAKLPAGSGSALQHIETHHSLKDPITTTLLTELTHNTLRRMLGRQVE